MHFSAKGIILEGYCIGDGIDIWLSGRFLARMRKGSSCVLSGKLDRVMCLHYMHTGHVIQKCRQILSKEDSTSI